ncbi:hypothetical protein KC19_2G272500 [Ceratodon purpureus]|uniref:Uncharacterized protein n=1 Tax=Ceratodon purpureus TaxID=3225 RepID=A0A8T0J140_CERPU|nr:hypothetical protein KC19_2G272500 [Ceratodon purpureus]
MLKDEICDYAAELAQGGTLHKHPQREVLLLKKISRTRSSRWSVLLRSFGMWSFTSAVAAMLDAAKMTTVTSLDDAGSTQSQPFQMSCSRFHQVLKIKSSASYVASNSWPTR